MTKEESKDISANAVYLKISNLRDFNLFVHSTDHGFGKTVPLGRSDPEVLLAHRASVVDDLVADSAQQMVVGARIN